MTHPSRRASDNTFMPWLDADTPWWAKLSLIILFWLGPAAIVAGIFLAMWTGWLPSPITDNGKILVRVESKLDVAIRDMKSEVDSSKLKDEHVVRLLLATCRNVAKTDVDKTQCDNYWRR